MGLSPIIDLYEKFLISFIGIVTPALSLFLNNYILDRSAFITVIKKQRQFSNTLIEIQNKAAESSTTKEGGLNEMSNKLLKETNERLKIWEDVNERLNPKTFFIQNVSLLSASLFFLFVWLLIRSEELIDSSNPNFKCYQAMAALTTIGLCVWHIINLIDIGLYIINKREIVYEINEELKHEKEKAKDRAQEAPTMMSSNEINQQNV